MNSKRILSLALSGLFCSRSFAQTQDIDKELTDLAGRLAAPITDSAKKKVTVIDFTDLDGTSSELGKYIADQLTVDMVMAKHDFSMLDRANLKSILDEHSLTAKGLVDPKNAKQLGQFAGVDAIVLGSIVPRAHSVSLTARIITTDTAEIVGAAKAEFALDDNVRQLISHAGNAPSSDDETRDSDKPVAKLVKQFPTGLRVEVLSLRIVNGKEYLLSMNISDKNSRAGHIAFDGNFWLGRTFLKSTLTDSQGYEFHAQSYDVTGVVVAGSSNGRANFDQVTPLKADEPVAATIKFTAADGRNASQGICTLQLGILSYADNGHGTYFNPVVRNVVGTITAE